MGPNGKDDKGIALLAVLMIALIMSILGMATLNMASIEIQAARYAQQEKVTEQVTDAASELVISWFHSPGTVAQIPGGGLFTQQTQASDGTLSFFNENGTSQFRGTADRPDVFFDAGMPAHDALLNHPATGWFRGLRGLGRVLKLKVYGPLRPGLLCTVEVTAAATRPPTVTRTLTVEFGTHSIPPLRSSVQAGGVGVRTARERIAPVLVHWGDLTIRGDVQFNRAEDVPIKTFIAPVNGQAYGEMNPRQDRWHDAWIGGNVLFTVPGSQSVLNLQNVHQHQEPVPGLKLSAWNYLPLKREAMLYGTYYGLGRDGSLYPGGIVQPGHGLSAREVLSSAAVNDHRGLIFIDTLDQEPPRADNLGTLVFDADYAEGLFMINAHVVWRPQGTGKTIPVLSPPPEGQTNMGSRVPVQLGGIHLQGVLYVAGDLTIDGQPRTYGAVVAEGNLVGVSPATLLEVWYEHELSQGLYRGTTLVSPVPGTRQVKS